MDGRNKGKATKRLTKRCKSVMLLLGIIMRQEKHVALMMSSQLPN